MRAPKNEATGTSGESEVLSQFQRLGWAGMLDDRHDTGTDLYLRPRDSRRYELGAVMGAQVKTGRSYFKSPERDIDGRILGWWFAEDDREHFDYWLHHALPHVVILRDQNVGRSYWVHVTSQRVISTGKGAKILVPASQVVDAEHNEALSDVAMTKLPTPTWDGTAWTGAVHLSPVDEIRHALITPRLIAPHPNLNPRSVNGIEALAMQVLLRDELERSLVPPFDPFAGRSDEKWQGLSLGEARTSDEWCWRATAALHTWLYDKDATELLQLGTHASAPAEHAAAAVLSCVYHFGENDPDASLQELEEALHRDDYSPIDHAWLQAQRARAMLEIGRDEEAFDLAMKTQRIHREAPSDVTASAISGACALTAFRAAEWMQGDVANFVQRSDNPASWWRSQVLSYGLLAHLSESFDNWTKDDSLRIGVSDRSQRRLLSAALLASSSGDQDGWRGALKPFAEHLLVSTSPDDSAETVANRLTLLRLAGDSSGVGRAARHIVDEGPTLAARIAAHDVELARSTRTSSLADIELLTAAGDILGQTHADEVCAWAIATLRDPQKYLERVRQSSFTSQYKIIYLLKSMIWALSADSLGNIIEYCLDLPPVTDDATAQTLARLIHAIPEKSWAEEDRGRASRRAGSDAAYLREAYLAVAAPTVAASEEEILRRARAGELMVIRAIHDLRALPDDAVLALTEGLRRAIESLIEDASKGTYGFGDLDPGKALALLGTWHPSHARWDCIEALLATPAVRGQQQSGTLAVLAEYGSKLPQLVRTQLVDHVSAMRIRVPMPGLFEDEDVRSLSTEAYASLVDSSTREGVVRSLLAVADASHRASAAHIMGRFSNCANPDSLLALAGDMNAGVRTAALGALGSLVSSGNDTPEILSVLTLHLERGGKRDAVAVISRLRVRTESAAVSSLLRLALRHPSAAIRTFATAQLSE